jgi:hypothetical protein
MERVPIEAYVLDTLMRDLVGHDKKPSAFIVYLFIYRSLASAPRPNVHLSHQTIADATGLSRSAVQAAIETLIRRRLVRAHRAFRTATPEYSLNRHWA